MNRWKLASFDLDGTLATISTSQHLAQKIGHLQAMERIEQLYAQGKASNAEVAALDGKYYKGYSKNDVDHLLADFLSSTTSRRQSLISRKEASHPSLARSHGTLLLNQLRGDSASLIGAVPRL